jgi:hypothetical protein
MCIRTYLRFKADYPIPQPGQSGAGEITTALAAGLRARGFASSEPEDQEFAHFFRCRSGSREYEIMAAFDFVEGDSWEVNCPPTLGFFPRLLGKTEEKELSSLIGAIHAVMQSNSRVKEMLWYTSSGGKSNGSPDPIQSAYPY